tara:strand:- start:476 stop:1060 length:585 start_codon:yes stop_codon:yes gene_type:complete
MYSSTLNDHTLVKNFIDGDSASFEVLLNRHKDRIYAFIMSKVKNKDLAEDVFHDALVKVINSLKKGKYNEEGKFLSWVMRIAHNLIIDHFRKESKMKKVRSNDKYDVFGLLDDGSKNKEEIMIKNQIFSDLNTLITYLPNDQSEVLKLRYFEDMSFKQISEITGVSINTALGRMRYALINLRKLSYKYKIDLDY